MTNAIVMTTDSLLFCRPGLPVFVIGVAVEGSMIQKNWAMKFQGPNDCLGYKGYKQLPSYIGTIISHDKDATWQVHHKHAITWNFKTISSANVVIKKYHQLLLRHPNTTNARNTGYPTKKRSETICCILQILNHSGVVISRLTNR